MRPHNEQPVGGGAHHGHHWSLVSSPGSFQIPKGGNLRIAMHLKGNILDADEILLPNPTTHPRIFELKFSIPTSLFYGPKTQRRG